jgi:hypothetical protein
MVTTLSGGLVKAVRVKSMLKRLYQAIAWYFPGVWRRTGRVRQLLGRIAARREREQEHSRRSVARARFWAEVHEGRREAEAHKESGA